LVFNMVFKTTAIYENRLLDKIWLESSTGLTEEGNQTTEFLHNGALLFRGYERIVYGDHGPYLEFTLQNIKCKLKSKFNNYVDYNNLPDENYKYYYYWLQPVQFPEIKVYLQIKPVHNLPNAPKRADGQRSCFNRAEGYADYKRGYFYVDPKSLTIRKPI
jgi:hypothetical protein